MTSTPRIQLGLGAMRALLEALGHPQSQYPCVLISGTNGKGSTASMLASIGVAAGLKTGLFHSPALGGEHEHLHIDGVAIDPSRFAAYRQDVLSHAEGLEPRLPTVFEVLTASAFLAFAREGVDLAIIEAGLGGERDSTNACEPEVSILVTVALDHQEYLGDSPQAIARDKAGIFRPGKPAILGWLEDEARDAAIEVASARRSHLTIVPERASLKPTSRGYRLEHPGQSYLLKPGLLGEHQARNAALAATAAEALSALFSSIDQHAIEAGLSSCRFPGRLEWRQINGRRLLLDAAHNPAAAISLAEYLEAHEARSGERCDLLFGAFSDKDSAAMLDTLGPHVGQIWLTALEHERSWSPREAPEKPWFESPREALDHALTASTQPLLIAGSISLVAALRSLSQPHPSSQTTRDELSSTMGSIR